MNKLTKMLTVAAVAAVTTASAVAIAATTSGPDVTPVEASAELTQPVPVVQPDIAGHFALFRDRPASAMPADVAEQMASARRHGRNATLARSISTGYGQGWVVPGDGFLCIIVPTPTHGHATSCVPTAVAIQRGLWLRLVDDSGKALDTVVAPDGSDVVVGTKTGEKTFVAGPDGVISRTVDTDGSGPALAPKG